MMNRRLRWSLEGTPPRLVGGRLLACAFSTVFLLPPWPAVALSVSTADLQFEDVTDAVGLGPEVVGSGVSRCLFADLNGDGWPDAVVQSKDAAGDLRPRVFLNVADAESSIGRRFEEVPPERTGLPTLYRGDNVVFADLDNDGRADAFVTRSLDLNNDDWTDHGERTAWHSAGSR